MRWTVAFFLVAFWGAGWSAGPAATEEKKSARLEQLYDQESNPRKRIKPAMELTAERLSELRAAYDAEDTGKRGEAVEACLSALGRLETAVTAAAHAGSSKNVEVHLRRQARDLENLKTSVSYFDRPAIEKVLARVVALREQILYSIMNPPERSRKK